MVRTAAVTALAFAVLALAAPAPAPGPDGKPLLKNNGQQFSADETRKFDDLEKQWQALHDNMTQLFDDKQRKMKQKVSNLEDQHDALGKQTDENAAQIEDLERKSKKLHVDLHDSVQNHPDQVAIQEKMNRVEDQQDALF